MINWLNFIVALILLYWPVEILKGPPRPYETLALAFRVSKKLLM